jgi:uncharacterized protein
LLEALERVLRRIPRPAVAVSGGVDSVSLAAAIHEITRDVLVMHAVSPAVPAEATDRVRETARRRGWNLQVLEAGEFEDPDYRANPVNRCFHCKSNLYRAIRALTERPILSGANLDDLGEYRPGLEAARLFGVRHPYVEAGIAKAGVRDLARELGLHGIADLPASPCLSSRVETGIRIEAATLGFIHGVERMLAADLRPLTVRCRIRAAAIAVELDQETLLALSAEEIRRIETSVRARAGCPEELPVRVEPYRNGSAFLVGRAP